MIPMTAREDPQQLSTYLLGIGPAETAQAILDGEISYEAVADLVNGNVGRGMASAQLPQSFLDKAREAHQARAAHAVGQTALGQLDPDVAIVILVGKVDDPEKVIEALGDAPGSQLGSDEHAEREARIEHLKAVRGKSPDTEGDPTGPDRHDGTNTEAIDRELGELEAATGAWEWAAADGYLFVRGVDQATLEQAALAARLR